MAVTIKSDREIELMREAGKILAQVHEALGKELKPGMTTFEIDRLGEEMIRSFGCEPSFKNYQGYPASVCVSVNEEVVHGIPSKKRFIQEGDIVS
ncbi:MAG: M24 family metallopeptidase, partial [Roseburia sp.]